MRLKIIHRDISVLNFVTRDVSAITTYALWPPSIQDIIFYKLKIIPWRIQSNKKSVQIECPEGVPGLRAHSSSGRRRPLDNFNIHRHHTVSTFYPDCGSMTGSGARSGSCWLESGNKATDAWSWLNTHVIPTLIRTKDAKLSTVNFAFNSYLL